MSTIIEAEKVVPQDEAINKMELYSNTFEGTVVSMTGNKLVMANKEGEEYSHMVASDAQLTLDGAVCKAEDLKAGSKIRVTTEQDDRTVATVVEVLGKDAECEQGCG